MIESLTSAEIVTRAREKQTAVPAFNVPYLDLMEPIVRALRDTESFGFIEVARLELIKFEAQSLSAVREAYDQYASRTHTRLHLDHVPVIDEDNRRVDYMAVIEEALGLGYDSVMVDGSRLSLEENVAATRAVCELAHGHSVPVEAEIGAVLGHESGPLPPYEELFASGQGFTSPDDAFALVSRTGLDWLSVAFGNIHGAISGVERQKEKPEAMLNIAHLQRITSRVQVPIVLHGGSGIRRENVLEAIKHGVAKINIASDVRRPYELARDTDPNKAIQAAYDAVITTLQKFELTGNAGIFHDS